MWSILTEERKNVKDPEDSWMSFGADVAQHSGNATVLGQEGDWLELEFRGKSWSERMGTMIPLAPDT